SYVGPITTSVSGTQQTRIRVISDKKWGAAIVSRGADAVWDNEADWVDIMGFDISGDGSLGILNNGSHVRIVGNRVHDIPVNPCTSDGGAGIDNGNFFASDDDIIANMVFNIGDPIRACPRVHGIYHSNLGGHIWNNIAFHNESGGIHLWHAPTWVTVANNLSFLNGKAGIILGAGDAPGGVVADHNLVVNNVLLYNGTANAGWAIEELGLTGPANLYSNNLIFANAGPIVLLTGVQQDTVSAGPLFVNFQANGTGDYRPAPSSPLIRTGTTQGAPSQDANGAPRPAGANPDIGPFQSGSVPARWPWM
ncbi:MAG TPA: right-handed parallel beta-helix repeat-containing protein, partial [Candidatus Acidoferrum sp.]|nr:right-handed parallel beta-helix repeat-containing protein [Candidatus Acidoferrum sp.]